MSPGVGNALLNFGLGGSLWLDRQLKNSGLLTFAQVRQKYDLAVRKFERIESSGLGGLSPTLAGRDLTLWRL